MLFLQLLYRLTGLVLLSAAVLKLSGFQVDATSSAPLGLPAGLTVALIEWELVLGGALLFGLFPGPARWAAVGTFAVFAAASGYAGWVGQADCGCFGRLPVHPWAVAAFDVAVTGLLTAFGPRPVPARPGHWRLARIAAVAALVFNGVVAGYAVQAGSLSAGLAVLQGESLTTDPAVLDFGDQVGGRSVEKAVRLTNHSPRPVRVVGGTSDCRCVATDDLPVTVGSGGSVAIRVRLKLPEGEGQFGRTVWLWSDAEKRLSEFRLTGVLVRGPAAD